MHLKFKEPQKANKTKHDATMSQAKHYQDTTDQMRDVPQSLLFPHSLDTTAPGRQVLLRWQHALVAPSNAPATMATPVSATTIDNSIGKDMVAQRKNGGWFGAKVQRIKENAMWLKRTMTPEIFPRAWIMFVIIIALAASVVGAGWWGVITEAKHHRTMPTANSSALITITPAEPVMAQTVSVIVTKTDAQIWTPAGFVAATMVESMALSPRSGPATMTPFSTTDVLDLRSDPIVHSTLTDGYAAEAKEADYLTVTTVFVTVTIDDETQPGSTSMLISTSTSIPTSTSVSTSILTLSARSTSASTSTSTPTSTLMSTWTSTLTSSMVTTSHLHANSTTMTASATSAELEFCPHSNKPDVWTLCTDSPSAAPANTGPDEKSAAMRGIVNPLSAFTLGVGSLWASVTDSGNDYKAMVKNLFYPPLDRPTDVTREDDCDCDCELLMHILNTAMRILEQQSQLLEYQQKMLLEAQEKYVNATHVLWAMRFRDYVINNNGTTQSSGPTTHPAQQSGS
ncbi:hypothetical protein F5Y04DRAFT_288435 [Hypomontagnella monticulosa]|nr:hypothetical protein F5Y04DRAFT_288435 [Hypomontagnella monticulosa]